MKRSFKTVYLKAALFLSVLPLTVLATAGVSYAETTVTLYNGVIAEDWTSLTGNAGKEYQKLISVTGLEIYDVNGTLISTSGNPYSFGTANASTSSGSERFGDSGTTTTGSLIATAGDGTDIEELCIANGYCPSHAIVNYALIEQQYHNSIWNIRLEFSNELSTGTLTYNYTRVQVTDEETGEPISGASANGYRTNSDGWVCIFNAPSGESLEVTVGAPGYVSETITMQGNSSASVSLERNMGDEVAESMKAPSFSGSSNGPVVHIPQTLFWNEREISLLDNLSVGFDLEQFPSVNLEYMGSDTYQGSLEFDIGSTTIGPFSASGTGNITASGQFNPATAGFQLNNGSASLNLSAGIGTDIPIFPLISLHLFGEGSISPTISLDPTVDESGKSVYAPSGSANASIGIGAAPKATLFGLASAEAGGKGIISAAVSDITQPAESTVATASISAFVKIKLPFRIHADINIPINSWQLYPAQESQTIDADISVGIAERDPDAQEPLFNPQPNTDTYIYGSDETPGGSSDDDDAFETGSDSSGRSYVVIHPNNSSTQVVTAWITDDFSRNYINSSKLVYSVSNDGGVTFSEPIAVHDDGTADYSPMMVTDNSGTYIVWQNAESVFSSDEAPEDIFKNIGLSAAYFNGERFEPMGVSGYALTLPNYVLEIQPVISADNGRITVTWAENTENNPLLMSESNVLCTMYRENDVWSEVSRDMSAPAEPFAIDINHSDNGDTYAAATTEDGIRVLQFEDTAVTLKDGQVYISDTTHSDALVASEYPIDTLGVSITGGDGYVMLYWPDADDDNTELLRGLIIDTATLRSKDTVLYRNGTVIGTPTAALHDGTVYVMLSETELSGDNEDPYAKTNLRLVKVEPELPAARSENDFSITSAVLDEDTDTIRAAISKNTSDACSAVVYCAFYNYDGTLISIYRDDIGDTAEYVFDAPDTGFDKAEIFVWDKYDQFPYDSMEVI